ncbi:hypothetical protein CYY_000980 [Polysphondylium violaceum]|uniref:Uncharacterized protein n=1 Tax=Polysphondylium violaceum TaxID=133409 RepID=A0A8J4PYW6_9MYCE|nr:hypothetical protein CYY_000980 [Polysphondylium violaceum]
MMKNKVFFLFIVLLFTNFFFSNAYDITVVNNMPDGWIEVNMGYVSGSGAGGGMIKVEKGETEGWDNRSSTEVLYPVYIKYRDYKNTFLLMTSSKITFSADTILIEKADKTWHYIPWAPLNTNYNHDYWGTARDPMCTGYSGDSDEV